MLRSALNAILISRIYTRRLSHYLGTCLYFPIYVFPENPTIVYLKLYLIDNFPTSQTQKCSPYFYYFSFTLQVFKFLSLKFNEQYYIIAYNYTSLYILPTNVVYKIESLREIINTVNLITSYPSI